LLRTCLGQSNRIFNNSRGKSREPVKQPSEEEIEEPKDLIVRKDLSDFDAHVSFYSNYRNNDILPEFKNSPTGQLSQNETKMCFKTKRASSVQCSRPKESRFNK